MLDRVFLGSLGSSEEFGLRFGRSFRTFAQVGPTDFDVHLIELGCSFRTHPQLGPSGLTAIYTNT